MHNNLVVVDLSPSYPMLCALDDMQAIWTLSFIDGHKKAGSEFNDFCVESPLIVIVGQLFVCAGSTSCILKCESQIWFC
jgi:hypothetical protein